MKTLSMVERSNLALSRIIDLTHGEFMSQIGMGAGLWDIPASGPFNVPRAAIVNTPFGLCLTMIIVEGSRTRSALGVGPFILDGAKSAPDFITPSEAEYLASVAYNHYGVEYALISHYSKSLNEGKMTTKIIPIKSLRNMVAHACFEQQHQPDPAQLSAAVTIHNVFLALAENPGPWVC